MGVIQLNHRSFFENSFNECFNKIKIKNPKQQIYSHLGF